MRALEASDAGPKPDLIMWKRYLLVEAGEKWGTGHSGSGSSERFQFSALMARVCVWMCAGGQRMGGVHKNLTGCIIRSLF